MLKRVGTLAAIVIVGLVVAGGTASAAPVYVPPGLSVVSINVDQILITVTNYGDEAGPDLAVTVTVSYDGPMGLRASSGLAAASAADTSTYHPDENGNLSVIHNLSQDGDVWVRVVGDQGGDDLTVFLADPPGVPGQGASSIGGKSYGDVSSSAYASGGGQSGGYSDLASTGASITAPLAIGIGALMAGLMLLFFGTRGVLRRKAVKSKTSN